MEYNMRMHSSVSLLIMFFVYLMIIIAAENYIFDDGLNSPFQKVLAHVSTEYGNITVQAGWDQEPPWVDEINDVVVGVTREPDLGNNSAIPVRNALSDMNIMVKYGGVTKSLDFVPSQEQEGWYEAKILPTRIGSYGLVLNGTIQNQPINDEVQIEDVESTQEISFPEASSGVSGGGGSSSEATNTNLLSGQISNILNQITNDINNIRDDIGTLAESNSNIQKGIQDVKDIADRSYIIAMTAIGVGAAGILIAAAALVRTR
jgi:hypothetical protein